MLALKRKGIIFIVRPFSRDGGTPYQFIKALGVPRNFYKSFLAGAGQSPAFACLITFLIKLTLAGIELVVSALHFKQLLMSTALDDLACFKYHDGI